MTLAGHCSGGASRCAPAASPPSACVGSPRKSCSPARSHGPCSPART